MFAAAAALSLTACNREEVNVPGNDSNLGETAYAKVSIRMAGTGTKAFDGFEKGDENESTIHSLALLLFDEAGDLVGTGGTAITYQEGADQNVQTTYGENIIKITLDPGTASPAKLLAYVNTNPAYAKLSYAIDADTDTFGNASNGYVMTNSAYYSGETWINAVDITPDKLFKTTAEASDASEDKVVEIYVERLAAKATVDDKTNGGTDNTADFSFSNDAGDAKYKLVYEAKNWELTGVASKMRSIKKEYKNSKDDVKDWANGDKRSYWAEGNYYGLYSYEQYTGSESPLHYLGAGDIISTSTNKLGVDAAYAMEHTYGTEAMNNGEYAPKFTGTNAIIVGQYKVVDAATGEDATKFQTTVGENVPVYDFYLASKMGTEDGKTAYYIRTKADLINYLYTLFVNKVSKSATAIEKLSDTDLTEYFDLKKNDKGQYRLELKDEKELYEVDDEKVKGDAALTKEYFYEINGQPNVSNSKHYQSGWAYFMAPIQHNYNVEKPETYNLTTLGAYGIVRNHVYHLNINKFNGLGAPLDETQIGPDPEHPTEDDPNPPIIPDPKEQKDAYLNATLNVMSWHIVSQEVDF